MNVEALLETKLSSKVVGKQEQVQTECGICYSVLLNEAAPDKVCDNEKCRQPFHFDCLIEVKIFIVFRLIPTLK